MFTILNPYLAEASAMRLRIPGRARRCMMALIALGMYSPDDAVDHPLGDVFFAIEVSREIKNSDSIPLNVEQTAYLDIAANVLEQILPGLRQAYK